MNSIETVKTLNGFDSFNPMQEKAIKAGVLEKSLVISSPTSSGKTVVAEIAAIHSIMNNKKKVVYTCPLRALASEHANDFKKKYSQELGVKSVLSTGDFDSSGANLAGKDVIFTTYEKCLHPEEFILYKKGDSIEFCRISDFFKLLGEKSKAIISYGKEDLIPPEDIFTLSLLPNGKLGFSKIMSVVKSANSETLVKLKFDSSREITLTKDHEIFSVENSELTRFQASDFLGRDSVSFADVSGVLHSDLHFLDLVGLFFEKNCSRLGVFFSSLDYDEFVALLMSEGKTRRQAMQKANRHVRESFMPFALAMRLQNIQITAFTGLRRDSLHKMPSNFQLTAEFGKFLGYFISEGYFLENKKQGFKALSLPMYEQRMIDDLLFLCKHLGFPFHYYPKAKTLHVVSRPLFYLFKHVFGIGKSDNKIIPDFSFFANENFSKGLIEGLFAGDGGPSPKSIEYSTKCKKLSLQLPFLLFKFNIHSCIYKQKIKGRPGTYWRIVIIGSKNVARFFSVAPKTKPNIESKAEEIISQKEGRDDLFSNVPLNVLFDKWPVGVPTSNHNVYMQFYRGQRTDRKNLSDFLRKNGLGEKKQFLQNELAYLRCKEIHAAEKPSHVYCLQTEAGNFFTGNGILVKNCNSLLNHNTDWLSEIGLLVVDEIHSLGSDRGSTLEVMITKLRFLNKKLQVLGLSATIPNASEIAEWLNAELVLSDYRPVHLKEGVFLDGSIDFGSDEQIIPLETDAITSIALDTLSKKKQALFFANTRRNSESLAKKLANLASKELGPRERIELEKASQKVLRVLEQPTEQCKTLSLLIKNGACFHNAGLMQKQREIIEESFKKNYLKFIASTTTLAAGVNLPAFRVVLQSPYRYSGMGMVRIPVSEWKQAAGRAGRPKYDSEGEALLIAKSDFERDDYIEYFVKGTPELVESMLSSETSLRFHLLSLIATGFVFDLESAEKFFSKTFFALQNNDLSNIFARINFLIKNFSEWGFVNVSEKRFEATQLGRRVVELYLDPKSAREMILRLEKENTSPFSYLFMIASSQEFYPLLSVSSSKESAVWALMEENRKQLPFDLDSAMFTEDDLVSKYYTSLMLNDWVDEVKEQSIVETFKIQPGILRAKLQNADWLCYSAFELSKILELEKHLAPLAKMRKRLKSGIKEELVILCELAGIGRVRARRLWNAGIKGIGDVKKTDVKDLARVLGSEKIAEKIKGQLDLRK